MTGETQGIAGLTPQIALTRVFDSGSRLSSIAASIGGTADYKNDYTYDNANRLTRIVQAGNGGNTVATKRIDLAYKNDDQFDTITRYNTNGTTQLVATTTFAYDSGIGRLTSIDHAKGVTALASYDHEYDLAGRIAEIDSLLDGLSEYTYDDRGQLTGADNTAISDETYVYDDNGNRDMAGHDVDPNNRLMSDGTYDYEYDDEGNRTAKETIATGERVEYEWDYRNRLTKITFKNSGGTVVKTVDESYDVFNRWVRSTFDSNGATAGGVSERFFSYDGNQIALEFDGTSGTDVSHRYLWGPAIDQILADEQVTSTGSAGTAIWPLTDHLGTARDLATYNSGLDTTAVSNHRTYDSFGNVKSETNSAVDHLFGFTGRPLDENADLQNNLNRWYDGATGQWISEDPIGFDGGDANLSRYASNQVIYALDADGLQAARTDKVGGYLVDSSKDIPYKELAPGDFPHVSEMNADEKKSWDVNKKYGAFTRWYFAATANIADVPIVYTVDKYDSHDAALAAQTKVAASMKTFLLTKTERDKIIAATHTDDGSMGCIVVTARFDATKLPKITAVLRYNKSYINDMPGQDTYTTAVSKFRRDAELRLARHEQIHLNNAQINAKAFELEQASYVVSKVVSIDGAEAAKVELAAHLRDLWTLRSNGFAAAATRLDIAADKKGGVMRSGGDEFDLQTLIDQKEILRRADTATDIEQFYPDSYKSLIQK